MLKFSLGQAVHENPDQPACGGPARGRQVGLAGTGQYEAPGCRPFINSPLDRAKYIRHDLPFIYQQGEGPICQRGVGIRSDDRCFGGPVKP
jgi:hypothetical protein